MFVSKVCVCVRVCVSVMLCVQAPKLSPVITPITVSFRSAETSLSVLLTHLTWRICPQLNQSCVTGSRTLSLRSLSLKPGSRVSRERYRGREDVTRILRKPADAAHPAAGGPRKRNQSTESANAQITFQPHCWNLVKKKSETDCVCPSSLLAFLAFSCCRRDPGSD